MEHDPGGVVVGVAEPAGIAAWHASKATNGPVEAINNLAKRIKPVAFGLTNWTHWRIRVLLYAGKPDWSKLPLITPTPT